MIRPVTRGTQGGEAPLKLFSLLVTRVGHSLKNLGPSQKPLRPIWCPGWLRACLWHCWDIPRSRGHSAPGELWPLRYAPARNYYFCKSPTRFQVKSALCFIRNALQKQKMLKNAWFFHIRSYSVCIFSIKLCHDFSIKSRKINCLTISGYYPIS